MTSKTLITAFAFVAFLSGCGSFTLFPGVHKIEIQQGNIIEQEMVDQLKPGMTKAQVRFVLGTPLIADTFNQDRWDYYYSKLDSKGSRSQEKFSVFFKDGTLQSFEGNIAPSKKTI